MKKRILNQLQSVTLAAVLVTGMAGGLFGDSAGIRAAEITDGFSDSVRLEQKAVWTDEEHFKAQVQIGLSGLDTLRTASQVENMQNLQKSGGEGTGKAAGNIWDESQREEMIPPEELERLELVEESAENTETAYPGEMSLEDVDFGEGVYIADGVNETDPAGEMVPVNDTENMDNTNHINHTDGIDYENMEETGNDSSGVSSEGIMDSENAMYSEDVADPEDITDLNETGDFTESLDCREEPETESVQDHSNISDAASEPDLQMKKYFLTTYISEYFQIEENQIPSGTQIETIVIQNQKGEQTELTKLNYPVEISETSGDSFELTFPVILREEYQVSAADTAYPVCQDEPLQKDRAGVGTYFHSCGNEGSMEENDMVLAGCPSEKLSVKAAEAGLAAALQADVEDIRAGLSTDYTLQVENTGKLLLENIEISSIFSMDNIKAVWEPEQGFQVNGMQGVLVQLKPGEKRNVRMTLQLAEDQSGELVHTVTVKAKRPGKEESIGCQTSAKITASALKAAFEVEKTADRKEAFPGDTITYQICIRNTGERTLHSVLSTERFLNANVQAKFVQKEGVTLNSTGTQALIPQIAPGEAFALYATVTLPQYFASQELINEVSVISDETGSETIRSQSNLTVNASEVNLTPTPTLMAVAQTYNSGYGAKTGNAYAASSKPKTGDDTETERFLIIGIFAAISGISGVLLKKYNKVH